MLHRVRASATALVAFALCACGPVEMMDASADRSVNDSQSNPDRSVNDDANAVDSTAADASALDAEAMDSGMDSGTDSGGARDGASDARADVLRADASAEAATDAAADGGYMLTGLPTCTAATVTAMQLYTGVVSTTCTGSRCHDPGSSGGLAMGSVAQMRTNLLAASSSANIPRVTAGDIHNSYVMYKLLGQQARITGGRGNRMPPMAPLNNTQLCLFVNWIRSGAR
ncbi:MAG: hypothetical protein U0269_36540 [Polyangiales bacterium]